MSSPATPELERTIEQAHLLNPLEQNPHIRVAVTLDPDLEISGFNEDDLAIDENYTQRPEDALSGAANTTCGNLAARRTLVDPCINNNHLVGTDEALDALMTGDFEGLSEHITGIYRPHYSNRKTRILSVAVPFCSTRPGQVVSPGPSLEYVGTNRFWAGARSLHDDTRYTTAERVGRQVAGQEYPGDADILGHNQKQRRSRAIGTVKMFATTTNSILTEWALHHQTPQIVKSKPEIIELSDRTATMSRYVASTDIDPGELARFPASHSGVGKRDQRIAGWINLIQVAHTLERGEPAFDETTIRLFAEGLTRYKMYRRSIRN